LDVVREDLDAEPTDNQGKVIQTARERCRQHLRAGTDFAFNGTNITREMRRRWTDLFADYGARIEIAYLEPELAAVLDRNKQRQHPVPEKVILDLCGKAEPPTLTECHRLAYFGSGCRTKGYQQSATPGCRRRPSSYRGSPRCFDPRLLRPTLRVVPRETGPGGGVRLRQENIEQ
jgi:hypothetical protein